MVLAFACKALQECIAKLVCTVNAINIVKVVRPMPWCFTSLLHGDGFESEMQDHIS